MEIFSALGINWKLLLGQIINFLIILYLLNRFVFKKLMGTVSEREKKIRQGIENANTSEKKLEETKLLVQKIEQGAHQNAQKIIEKGRKDGITEKGKIIQEAQDQKLKIMKGMESQIEAEKKRLLAEIQGEALDMTKKMTAKILAEVIGEKEDKAAIKNAFSKLKAQ